MCSIVGVQAFSDSYKRYCVWIGKCMAYAARLHLPTRLTLRVHRSRRPTTERDVQSELRGLLRGRLGRPAAVPDRRWISVSRVSKGVLVWSSQHLHRNSRIRFARLCMLFPDWMACLQETGNPVVGTWSFDNVLAALFQVVIIASGELRHTFENSLF